MKILNNYSTLTRTLTLGKKIHRKYEKWKKLNDTEPNSTVCVGNFF